VSHVHKHRFLAAGLAAGLLLTAAGCGSSSGGSSGSGSGSGSGTKGGTVTGTKDAAAAKLVPKKVADAGTLTVASDASYAPSEFFDKDGKTVIGFDADLAKAIGDELGLKVTVQNAGFDSIIPALGNRYDVGMSSFTDTLERQKTVDFVDYFEAGTSFYVEKGKNSDITTLDAICGKKVAVEKGTTQLDDATAQNKKCAKQATVLTFQDQNGANLALSSGRADAVMADSPVAAYAAEKSNGKFEVIGKSYGNAPYGVAIPKSKDYAGMDKAVQAALEKLQADGTYLSILKKWGVESGAVTKFPINGVTS
jgi:polar amino acid transport system substrate-binding protein